jgi:hypothetical protein
LHRRVHDEIPTPIKLHRRDEGDIVAVLEEQGHFCAHRIQSTVEKSRLAGDRGREDSIVPCDQKQMSVRSHVPYPLKASATRDGFAWTNHAVQIHRSREQIEVFLVRTLHERDNEMLSGWVKEKLLSVRR